MRGVVTLLVLIVVSVGVFFLGGVQKRGKDKGKALLHVAEEVALTVDVAHPQRGRIIRLVQAPGDVEAVLEVEISSEIVSKIVEMPVEEGDEVREGDLLCKLDDKNLLADVESGEARIAQLHAARIQAEADLEKAERDVARQVRLSEADATSNLELRDYITLRKKATALVEIRRQELVQAEAVLKRVKEDLKKTIITAPIDGVISKLSAKQGEVVVTGTMNNPGTVIMTISDLSRMQVRARVDEVDIPLVRDDQVCRIYLQSDPDSPVPARVVRVASKGTRTTGRDIVTFEALLEVLSDDARIKPGMTANVEIEVARRDDAITVPVEAIVHRMRKDLPETIVKAFDERQGALGASERVRQGQYIKVLYVMNGEAAEVRLVDPGIADTRRVELRQGVGMDDLVVVGPYRSLDQLKEGRKVASSKKDKEESGDDKESADADDERVAQDDEDATDSKPSDDGSALAASASP